MDLISPTVRRWQAEAREDPEGFWARAAEECHWVKSWDRVLDWDPPNFQWYAGGQTNIAYNCLDYHVARGWGGHAALIAVNEGGERLTWTYAQLLEDVKKLCAALRGMGIGKGDRVAIYMPTCGEAVALMLACARIGAVHLIVFAGFGANALGDRIQMSGAKAAFATDITYRKAKRVPLKGLLDDAIKVGGASIEKVVILRRTNDEIPMTPGRDIWWEDFLALSEGQDDSHEVMESNDPLYILATSGTTARPKLTVHNHGPYMVHVQSMADWMFALQETDVWWATSDIGWAVGHAYITYAPLLVGATTIAFEGAIDHPSVDTFYRILEENHVSGVFTSPTAVRLFMRYGTEPARKRSLAAIERVFCAGEVLNPPAWEWLQKEVFEDRIAVVDHMWQTETAGPIVGNPYGLGLLPIKPGSSGVLLPGIEGTIMTIEGEELGPGERGIFVINRPFPGLTPTLWGEHERWIEDYWRKIPGKNVYFSGDATSIDEDGYVWFSGRADEIIKIAAHRIGTIEVETAFLRHAAVAEAGVTGRPDDLRGEVISAFIVLKAAHQPSETLRKELYDTVRKELGPVAVIGELNFVAMLPKTRSGKIMRRVLKAVTLGKDPGDISTIEDEGSVEEAREAWQEMTDEVAAATPPA